MKKLSLLYPIAISLLAAHALQASQTAHQPASPSFMSAYNHAFAGACGTWAANNTFNILGGLGLLATGLYLYHRITRMERQIAQIHERTAKMHPMVEDTHKIVTETAHHVALIRQKQDEHSKELLHVSHQVGQMRSDQDEMLQLARQTYTHVSRRSLSPIVYAPHLFPSDACRSK